MLPASPPTADTPPLVTASLTFLMTDVEGSTALWEAHEAIMHAALARHDVLVDAAISAHGGRRVKERGEGDSIFAVFIDPRQAVRAAVATQCAILAEPWPAATPIRVRMGLHTGLVALRDGDYYGPAINRCARVRGLGHGGQILLSRTTALLVEDALDAPMALRSLGAHALKGLPGLEEIVQVLHTALPDDFPPLQSPQAPRGNLPIALTSFIGREREQAQLAALLGASRLATLVGPGGSGKTRLALQVAAELRDDYRDGVWLVELAALSAPELVAQTAAQVFGVREEPRCPLLETLAASLRERRLVLVLDNCEHLLAAAAALAHTLLRSCPGLRILATSQAALEVTGESVLPLPPLSVPAATPRPVLLEMVRASEAGRLFEDRARARRPDFALTEHNAGAVSQICARLDGIPLAIELAAARAGVLTVEQIAARLDDRFRLLTGNSRTVLPRQQTLRAAVEWSFSLLGAAEAALMRRLAVFAGGWSLEAAEAVCAGAGLEDQEILDLLAALVGKSLVFMSEHEGVARYRLLETVRAYAGELLREHGEAARVGARHRDWYARMASEAGELRYGAQAAAWLDRLETEHDNLRAALAWSRDAGERLDQHLDFVAVLRHFWTTRGYWREAWTWLDDALARSAPDGARGGASSAEEATARARVFNVATALAHRQSDMPRFMVLAEEANACWEALGEAVDPRGRAANWRMLSLVAEARGENARARALMDRVIATYQALGDRPRYALAIFNLGVSLIDDAAYDEGETLVRDALALFRAQENANGIAFALLNLGIAAIHHEDYALSIRMHEESLPYWRRLGDRYGEASALTNLGFTAERQGDAVRAAHYFDQGGALFAELGDDEGLAGVREGQGELARQAGEYGRAKTLYREALRFRERLGLVEGVATDLDGLARIAAAAGRHERATRLHAAAVALFTAQGASFSPKQVRERAADLAAPRAALGDDRFAAAISAGQALTYEQAIALAMRDEDDGNEEGTVR